MIKPLKVIYSLIFLLLAACATSPNSGRYRNPELANFNPAPRSMSPPEVTEENQILDPTHLRAQADYHYALGEAYSLDGEPEKAIEKFKLTTIYDPNAAPVRLRLAGEYLKQGLLTEAVEQAEHAQKLDPHSIDVHMFLGGLYTALKMYKQAFENYQYVFKKDPQHPEAAIYLGALYAEQERYDEAEKYFLKSAAQTENEKSYLAHYYIGKMRMSQGEAFYKQAEKSFNRSLQIKPDFDESVLALSDIYVARKDKNKSLRLLESYQAQFGPKKSVAFQLSQAYLEAESYDKALRHLQTLESFEPKNLNVKVKIALILIEQKKYDEAIEKLEAIITLAPGSDKIRFYLAAVYEETNKVDLAIRNFRKIESSSTYYPDAVVHAAFLYRKQQDLKSAANLLEAAIRQRDDVPQFYAFYASVLDEVREYQKGIAMLTKAVEKFGDNTQLRFYLGSMYDRVGRRQDTITEMRRVLAIDADHAQALNYLAYTYAELGQNLEEAEQLAIRAMRAQPNDGYILDTLGWVLFKQGRVEDAIQYLEAAFRLKPEESIIAEHLGDAYYVFELSDKAKQMYLRAAASEGDPVKAGKIRAKISALENRLDGQRTPASARGE